MSSSSDDEDADVDGEELLVSAFATLRAPAVSPLARDGGGPSEENPFAWSGWERERAVQRQGPQRRSSRGARREGGEGGSRAETKVSKVERERRKKARAEERREQKRRENYEPPRYLQSRTIPTQEVGVYRFPPFPKQLRPEVVLEAAKFYVEEERVQDLPYTIYPRRGKEPVSTLQSSPPPWFAHGMPYQPIQQVQVSHTTSWDDCLRLVVLGGQISNDHAALVLGPKRFPSKVGLQYGYDHTLRWRRAVCETTLSDSTPWELLPGADPPHGAPGATSFDDLEEHIISEIMTTLWPVELAACAMSCRKLRRLASAPWLWKAWLENSFVAGGALRLGGTRLPAALRWRVEAEALKSGQAGAQATVYAPPGSELAAELGGADALDFGFYTEAKLIVEMAPSAPPPPPREEQIPIW
mmetsp:Transcript_21688/g.73733  ORF Transcript_21688/g.73733 Transcript_21688/m.73733 type:complete len:414 (+) Transcript_21688:41-1282(+)